MALASLRLLNVPLMVSLCSQVLVDLAVLPVCALRLLKQLMNVAPFAPVAGRLAGRMIKATEGMPVGMSIKPCTATSRIAC
jgi:hypothetical protein